MATIALSFAGAALGGSMLGGAAIGGVLIGPVLGKALGSIAGSYIDSMLFGGSGQSQNIEGPRLEDLSVTASTEGAYVPTVYGSNRQGGQIIWATNYEEVISTSDVEGGGKGGSGGPTQTTYTYYANFAVALCKGPITRIGRIWSDGKLLDLSKYDYHIHLGEDNQQPDSIISAIQGVENTPAYKGVAYIVFERMLLTDFGNRIPNLTFEVVNSIDDFEAQIKAMTIIPASGEFVYDTIKVQEQKIPQIASYTTINNNSDPEKTDFVQSVETLQTFAPNLKNASLIVSWFGDDVRAGVCTLKPKTDNSEKHTTPISLRVAGLSRSSMESTTEEDGSAVFGGTPDDGSVIRALQHMHTKGIKATFYPFILMDIPSGNSKTDPYGKAEQAAYPWRGRITCTPSPEEVGTVDGTATARTQVEAFIGVCLVSQFSIVDSQVQYTGPTEWSYRRMVLHYATLCKIAGNVDAFLIGSELVGLNKVRDQDDVFIFVQALKQLAADVRSILGNSVKISYAADWSEFGTYVPHNSNDTFFHLDPLWSSPHIDAVSIDNYWPISDWRDDNSHLDIVGGNKDKYAQKYLQSNIFGGEGYDWYYATSGDRDTQTRTPITEWEYRYKDIRSWWGNLHHERANGIASTTPTTWLPESKPMWFTELGAPAVDNCSNQPNVFVDSRSSESALPYYSNDVRDDYAQRMHITAFLNFFDPTHTDYVSGNNPSSNVYVGTMLDVERMYLYTWDARPYPYYPYAEEIWGDGDSWSKGHWLTGRLTAVSLSALVKRLLDEYGVENYELEGLHGIVQGYVIDRILSLRSILQPLELAYFFDSYESGEQFKFISRNSPRSRLPLTLENLVEPSKDGALYTLTRKQHTELPSEVVVSYIDADNDYRKSSVSSMRQKVDTDKKAKANLSIILNKGTAQNIANKFLWEAYTSLETCTVELPPSQLGIEPTDLIELTLDSGSKFDLRVTKKTHGKALKIESLSIDTAIYNPVDSALADVAIPTVEVISEPVLHLMDLPVLSGSNISDRGYCIASKKPWIGGTTLYKASAGTSYILDTYNAIPGIVGVTVTDFWGGVTDIWDTTTQVWVEVLGKLYSRNDAEVLSGANLCAIQNSSGSWEVLQFANAELVGPNKYKLTRFLRSRKGTNAEMRTSNPVSSGANFVMLDGALKQPNVNRESWGNALLYKYGPVNQSFDHDSYQDKTFTFNGVGERPYSPTHLRSAIKGSSVEITWLRRTRINGDNWQISTPLNEVVEKYQIDIFDSLGAVVRTHITSQTKYTYLEADRISDHGSDITSFTVQVVQVSETFGSGSPIKKLLAPNSTST